MQDADMSARLDIPPDPRPNRHRTATTFKRYLLFAGDRYYPEGGWADYIDSYSSVRQARAAVLPRHDWWHVVDIQTGEIVEHGRNSS